MPAFRIDTTRGRAALEPRKEPYWQKIGAGQFVGFRKLDDGTGTWNARYRDDEGKQKFEAFGELADFDAAVERARAWIKHVSRGVTGKTTDGERVTVATCCARFVEHLTRANSERAARYVENTFAQHVVGTPDGKLRRGQRRAEPSKLARVDVLKLQTYQLKDWRDRLLDKMQKRSVNRVLADLKAALHLAKTDGLAPPEIVGILDDVKLFAVREDGSRQVYLSRAERERLFAAAAPDVADLLRGISLLGCRPGREINTLTVRNFDARRRTLTFVSRKGRGGVERSREFPLTAAAFDLLRRLAKDKLPSAFLFTQSDGRPWRYSDDSHLVREAVTAAKLDPATVAYSLRHSFITDALESGIPPTSVAKVCGTSVRMIEKHYAKLLVDATRDHLERMHAIA